MVATVSNFSAFAARLRENEEAATGADYRRYHRELKRIDDGPALRIAVQGNFTLDLLTPFLAVHCAKAGWHADLRLSPFGQYFQDLGTSGFREFGPEIILLMLSLPLLRPDAINRFAELSAAERQNLRDGVIAEIEQWAGLALAGSTATLVIGNFPMPDVPAAGVADLAADYGETEFYLDLNRKLLRRFQDEPRVQILDLARISARVGTARAFDARMFHMAKCGWTDAMMAEVGSEISRHVIAAKGAARKCLVLDLDNTVWGGVLGEDGPDGVKVGPGDPHGEAFLAFQHRVRALKQRGILLAMCSKNNAEDVEEMFRVRPDMPLKRQDFAAAAISWNPKHVGLTDIAQKLNIGLDALVFMDDNPAEIAQMRAALPMVESVLMAGDPSDFVATLDRLISFEKPRILAGDVAKTEQYARAAEREALWAAATGPQDYLNDLGIVSRLWEATQADLPRLHQMVSKTNQFNVTTPRYTIGELERMLASPDHRVVIAEMRDRFGNLGPIAAYILEDTGERIAIDSLLMSCRAMGRGLESVLMNDIKHYALEAGRWDTISATFIPTARNEPASAFFPEQGFALLETQADGRLIYELRIEDVQDQDVRWISLVGA